MAEKIFLVPKEIVAEALRLKNQRKYSDALSLLYASGVEFDMTNEVISISKSANFEKRQQPDKVKYVVPRWRERIFLGN